MHRSIAAVAAVEFKRLRKSWLFWIGLIVIVGGPLFLDSPLSDGHLWTASSAAYSFSHGACMMGSFFMPIIIIYLYYYDQRTEIAKVIFTQPIKPYQYALGKFWGGFLLYLFIVLIGFLINIVIPLYFKALPYSPLIFVKAGFVYLLPSMFYYATLCYIIAILLKEIILEIVLPLLYMLLSDPLPPKLKYLIDGDQLATLAWGEKLPTDLVSYLLWNRLLFIVIGIVLLLLAVVIYSPRKYIESR